MRIAIDARIYGAKRGGIGRYTQEFLCVLPKVLSTFASLSINSANVPKAEGPEEHRGVESKHTFVVLMRKNDMANYNPNSRYIEKVCADAREYGLKEQIIMPLLLHDACIDLLHVPHIAAPYFWRGPTVLTAHDLIEYKYRRPEATSLPPFAYALKHRAYKKIAEESLFRARAIIAVSLFAKNDIQKHFPSVRAPIHVVHPGLAELKSGEGTPRPPRLASFDSAQDKSLARGRPLRKPYMLYVGNGAPHKNVERLFAAYRACVEKDKIAEHLVMVMPDDFHTRKFSALVSSYSRSMRERVHIVHGADEGALSAYYKHANLFVSASKEEGYGMPFAEALAHGTRVLAGFVGALPEFSSPNVHYWDTRHIPSMRSEMVRVLHKWERGKSVPDFSSWQDTAEQVVKIYNQALPG